MDDRPTSGYKRRRPVRPCLVASILLSAAAFAACSDGNGPESVSSTTEPTTAPSPDTPNPVETPCLAANPAFTDRGTTSVLGGTRPDARQLAGIDWVTTPECERIVFSFFTSRGAPASQIGLSRLEFAPEQGILRIEMPRDVDTSGVADTRIEGTLVERAFVVRSRSGSLSVDLYFAAETPIEARGLIIGSPARLVIDLRPATGGDPIGVAPPTIADDVVVLSPAAGKTGYPLRVRGYARTPDEVVTVRLTGQSPGFTLRVATAPSSDSWGEFALTISEGQGPSGEITLTVADEDPTSDSNGSGASISLSIP